MQAELRCRHFEVTGLKSANNLFRELQIIKPDILIVDFILDELNGGSLCHQLKCNPNTRSLPVVILSDYTGMERFSAKFGCDNIIYKQADIYKMTDALVDAIKSTNVPS
jgi:PleD family two-component response regulator